MTQQNSRETEEHPRFSLIVAYSNSAAMSSPSESSKGKKRRREAEIEDDGGDNTENFSLEDCLTFNDTLAALHMMRAQFPTIDKVQVL
ncbi:serine/threonine-protein kinase 19-like protein isoform X2 [Cucumis melo var. makuwa]|uniref:Serine/threonine-protein kinase 19-like protein isoform X2 n=1 Tax=Cucumis melo var. makuwa TaxID=1194695 RepID=A0A5A7TF62_CUCMM|nr:serine/threonine-protein kinase 19-like protein isoform X2 [Cucumis melo var. makuwa]TYK18016.1 serine/threonine-protein kinase 19-like protein isoform X2 [Cucumis melo var. makuwa]